MVHYDREAKKILKAVLAELRKADKSDGKSIIHAMKLIYDADKIAIECAIKLAPFQAPTLKSVEVKSKVEHRYVMRAPVTAKSTDEWVKQTGASQSDKPDVVKTFGKVEMPKKLTINDLAEIDEDEDDIEDQRRSLMN